jgi:hypothetical protein
VSAAVRALFRFPEARERDPAVERWMLEHAGPLGAIAQRWFDAMRACGADVRELLHDGQPTACVGDAAFGYVDAFADHVNVGFYQGAALADPSGLLEGTGKFMRHVKLRQDQPSTPRPSRRSLMPRMRTCRRAFASNRPPGKRRFPLRADPPRRPVPVPAESHARRREHALSTIPGDSDDEWEREQAEAEADRLRKEEPPPSLSESEFAAWRSPRLGSANPTRLDNPLWHWLVRTRWSAYRANELLSGPCSFDAGPMWSFDRFGMSATTLDDGSVVYIGGEHEDHYDPDFFIYNDVIVVDAAGAIAIHGYPREDFPPTDFHSATRVGDSIYIIGRLGYPDSRDPAATPVYRLSLDTMRIAQVATRGESPGWIYRHSASLDEDGRTLLVSAGECWLAHGRAPWRNIDTWAFDTQDGEWRRVTRHDWQRWIMRRVDLKPNRLWDTRQALWHREHAWAGLEDHWPHGEAPDLAALARLYCFEGAQPPSEESGVGAFRVVVDGVTIRIREERFWIEAIVEGRLGEGRLAEVQFATLALLECIDAAKYEIEPG